MMDSFKIEFEKIWNTYCEENPFSILLGQKIVFAKNPLILYGCGVLCSTVISVCNDHDIKITAICDTYKIGMHSDSGLEIISPKCLKEQYPDANIIICSFRFYNEIKNQLNKLGFPETRIFQATLSKINLIHPVQFNYLHFNGYEWAYNFFTDNISKKIILDRIRMYLIGIELSKTSTASTYFDPEIISLGPNEVFVDGGAYIGDTAVEFINQVKMVTCGEYRHIYSFEPDDSAREEAIYNLRKYSNIDVIGKGLWNCDTELKFYSDGGNASSTFVTGGVRTHEVPVTSIDSFFMNMHEDELPTFIKMDIEGAEKEALIGAKNVIMLKHPKLAICAYHKPEDIYELPRQIYELDPTYKFILQQCADGIYDTVLYAV